MRWLALDVGTRRVGVAISDDAEQIVTPLPALPWRGAVRLAEAVIDLAARRGVEGLVVGIPVTQRGEGRGEARVAAVAAALRDRFAREVIMADERGTTRDARDALAAAGVPRRRWDELVDGVAAKAILERWLEERRRRRSPGATFR
jgi:putative pre-16S rRNA nuclease